MEERKSIHNQKQSHALISMFSEIITGPLIRFIRTEEDNDDEDWEKRMAKKYYDKLFKEYCLADLTRYQEGQIGLRWRTQKEVFVGKGQFICGNKKCDTRQELCSYEVDFIYAEDGQKKNTLVKLRVCPPCAELLNFKHKQKLAKSSDKKGTKRKKEEGDVDQEKGSNKHENKEEGEEGEEIKQEKKKSKLNEGDQSTRHREISKTKSESHLKNQKTRRSEKDDSSFRDLLF